jgi:hypothetical protein
MTTDGSHRHECLHVTILATTFPTTSQDNRQYIQSVHRTSWCAPANWDISCAHHAKRATIHNVCVHAPSRNPTICKISHTGDMNMGAHLNGSENVFLNEIAAWKISYTHHTKRVAHLYECEYEILYESAGWKISYTHHKNRDAHLYECEDVSSNNVSQQKTVYTHYTKMDAPHCVCANVF